MEEKLEKVSCDFCGSLDCSPFASQKDLIYKLSNATFNVVKCNQCGLKYTSPRPSQKDISNFYSNKYSFHLNRSKYFFYLKRILESLSKSIFIRKLSFIFPEFLNQILIKFLKPKISDPVLDYIKENSKNFQYLKFLDIGCGSGLTTNFWGSKSSLKSLKRIIDVYGVEPSINSREVLSQFQIKSYPDINSLDNKYKFDIIRLNWSLEHVHSPSNYFRFIEKNLSNDGIAIICVPNINGLIYKINPNALELPVHLYHFDLDVLGNYSKKYNLKKKKSLTFSYPEMYIFAERVGLICDDFKFSEMSLSSAFDFQRFHKVFDNIGFGNDILLILEKDLE